MNLNVVQYQCAALNNSHLTKRSAPILWPFPEDNCVVLTMWKYNVYCQILPNPWQKNGRIGGMIVMSIYQRYVSINPNKWLHSCSYFHVRQRQCVPEYHPSHKKYIGKGYFETSNPSQWVFVEPSPSTYWSHLFFKKANGSKSTTQTCALYR